MRVATKLLVMAIALACGIAPAAAQNKSAGSKPKARSSGWETGKPMTFYVAQGPANSCGEGCNEWIAAEGTIGPNSADRLRQLLKRLGRQQLPIVFNSPGGLRSDALALGRLLRERGMAASVGETTPADCEKPVKDDDKKCGNLKLSGKKLQAELTTAYATCNSACVYAFLGAKKRALPAGAHLGIHTGRALLRDGNRTKEVEKPDKRSIAERGKLLRQYIREMGVDSKLADAAEKIPNDKIHYLTRDEVIAFRIDTRESHETPWMLAYSSYLNASRAVKFWIAADGSTKKEFPTSALRVHCANGTRLVFTYFRGLSAERARSPQVELIAGDQPIKAIFQGSRDEMWIENKRMFENYFGPIDSAFLEKAKKDGITVTETGQSHTPAERRVLTLSPTGWKDAVDGLKCGKSS